MFAERTDGGSAVWLAAAVLLVAVVALVLSGSSLGTPRRDAATATPSRLVSIPSQGSFPALGASGELALAARSLAGGTAVGNASTTPGWSDVSSSIGVAPPYRNYGRAMAYDPLDRYVVLFGGDGATGYLDDTWTFHGGKWTQLHPKTSPSARDHSTLAWDPTDGYLVLFSGSGGSGNYGDTWKFVHGNWTQLSPKTAPSARWASALAWDGKELLLFGGCGGSAIGDTWTFLGGNWTQHTLTTAPAARENAVLVWDPVENYTVLFGGDDYASGYMSDTWTYHEGNWTQLKLSSHPAARSEASAAFDATLGAIVMFGGDGSAATLADTWWFANGAWSQASSTNSPGARYFGIMSADPADSVLVLFSGAGVTASNDTWLYYNFSATASVTPASGTAPFTATFSASEVGAIPPVRFLWNLGNGNVSTNASVNVTYTVPGFYSTSVTLTDADGATAQIPLSVQAKWPLVVDAGAAPLSGTAPLTVQFSATGSGGTAPYSFAWSSGNGNSSTASSPSFTYDLGGSFQATLTVTDSAGLTQYRAFDISVAAKIIPPLTASLATSVTSGPAPLSVFFAGAASGGVPPYSFGWAFGDGGSSSGTFAEHAFPTAGAYIVTLTASDARGVRSTAQATIAVSTALWLTASLTPSSVPARAPVTFSASVGGGAGPYFVTWNLGDGQISEALNTTHSYAIPGTYAASVTAIDAIGHSVSENFTIAVTTASPPPPTTTPPSTGTNGGSAALPGDDWIAIGVVLGAVIVAAAVVLVRPRVRIR